MLSLSPSFLDLRRSPEFCYRRDKNALTIVKGFPTVVSLVSKPWALAAFQFKPSLETQFAALIKDASTFITNQHTQDTLLMPILGIKIASL